jgi:hypothetical protein
MVHSKLDQGVDVIETFMVLPGDVTVRSEIRRRFNFKRKYYFEIYDNCVNLLVRIV